NVAELMARVRKMINPSPQTALDSSGANKHGAVPAISDTFRCQAEFNRCIVESLHTLASLWEQIQAEFEPMQERLRAAEEIRAAIADNVLRLERRLATADERAAHLANQFSDVCHRLDELTACLHVPGPETPISSDRNPNHFGWWSRIQAF